MAAHESFDPYETSVKWEMSNIDLGVDSGQMSISGSENWTDKEASPDYEGPETPDPDYPGHMCRGRGGPYWKICDITSDKHAGVLENRVLVSSTGYGDGSYAAFIAKNNNNKVVAICVLFINDTPYEEN